jgi:Transposase DDE domain
VPANAALPIKYTPANRPGRIVDYKTLNRAYVDRGRLETWVDVELFKRPERVAGQNGRPQEYSDGLVQMLLLLKIRYNLPYRALEGFSMSLFQLFSAGYHKAVPSFGTTAERVRALGRSQEALIRSIKALARAGDDGKPKCLLIDSTGISITGMGPWRASRPWADEKEVRRRQFVKLHTAVNPVTGMIEMAMVTDSSEHDGALLPVLIDEVNPERVAAVAADGAYDSKSNYGYLVNHGIRDIRIPPPGNAAYWEDGVVGAELRDKAVVSVVCYGRKEHRKRSGYHVRSLVESSMFQVRSLTGSRARNRTMAGITAEILAGCVVLNKQASLGRAEYNQRAWTATWLSNT